MTNEHENHIITMSGVGTCLCPKIQTTGLPLYRKVFYPLNHALSLHSYYWVPYSTIGEIQSRLPSPGWPMLILNLDLYLLGPLLFPKFETDRMFELSLQHQHCLRQPGGQTFTTFHPISKVLMLVDNISSMQENSLKTWVKADLFSEI